MNLLNNQTACLLLDLEVKLKKTVSQLFMTFISSPFLYQTWSFQSCIFNQDCHMDFIRTKSAQFGIFWNWLTENKLFGYLNFFACLNVKKNSNLFKLAVLKTFWIKLHHFWKFLIFAKVLKQNKMEVKYFWWFEIAY